MIIACHYCGVLNRIPDPPKIDRRFRCGNCKREVEIPQSDVPDEMHHYYRMLGVEPGVSAEEVKEAYRDLVKIWHPDRFANGSRVQRKAEERLKEINDAYERLQSFRSGPKPKTPQSASWSQQPGPRPDTGSSQSTESQEPAGAQPPTETPQMSPRWLGRCCAKAWFWFRERPAAVAVVVVLLVLYTLAYLNSPRPSGTRKPSLPRLPETPSVATPSKPRLDTPSPPRRPSVEYLDSLDERSKPPPVGRRPETSRPLLSLPSGTEIIRPRGPKGLGSLRIINGTSLDAVAKLVEDAPPRRTRRLVYVRANSEATIKDIGPCRCLLQFSTGVDWDRSSRKFLEKRSYSQFADPLEFEEVERGDRVQYATYELTLHPVPRGKARIISINEGAFEEIEPD